MHVHDNYYQCCYNNNLSHIIKTDFYDKWDISFNQSVIVPTKVRSFREELLYACELMYDNFRKHTPTLNLLFSGGTDSECLLRCFVNLGIPVNPIVIIHHHVKNSPETLQALSVCNELRLTPTVVDINLIELATNGVFHEIGLKYQTPRIGMHELLHTLEIIREPAILGDEIKLKFRSAPDKIPTDVEDDQQWYFYIEEDQDGVFNRYQHVSGIPMISDSFRYTPACWAAMILTPEMKDIVFNDRKKASGLTTKNAMMSREFGVRYREKTNVFIEGSLHQNSRNKLFTELSSVLFPFSDVYIEYNKLLSKLGVEYEV